MRLFVGLVSGPLTQCIYSFTKPIQCFHGAGATCSLQPISVMPAAHTLVKSGTVPISFLLNHVHIQNIELGQSRILNHHVHRGCLAATRLFATARLRER